MSATIDWLSRSSRQARRVRARLRLTAPYSVEAPAVGGNRDVWDRRILRKRELAARSESHGSAAAAVTKAQLSQVMGSQTRAAIGRLPTLLKDGWSPLTIRSTNR